MTKQRLTTRLNAIERTTSSDLSDDAARLLVLLIARFDALWWPWREHSDIDRAEIKRLQLEFLNGMGAIVARAQGESNWKSAHHARNELVFRGLCKAVESGGQVTGLKLTPQGISDARAIIGDRLHPIRNDVSLTLLKTLLEFPGCNHSGKWMIESRLFGDNVVCSTNPTDWDYATEYLLPLLRCGLVASTSDMWHRCYFIGTDRHKELPEEPESNQTVQEWADDFYIATFDAERIALKKLRGTDGGIFIPMRCT